MNDSNSSCTEWEGDWWACQWSLAEVAERLQVMRRQEESTYRSCDYLGENGGCCSYSSRSPVNGECRLRLCGWCFQVAEICQYRGETVDVAMSLLDRFCSTTTHAAAQQALQSKSAFQLAAMTCLYIAVKLCEPVEMETRLLAHLSRGEYSAFQLARMETVILTALQWRIQGPTRWALCEHVLALVWGRNGNSFCRSNPHVARAIWELSQYQSQVATSDYFFTTQRHSVTAVACIWSAMEAIREASDNVMAFRMEKLQEEFRRVLQAYAGVNPCDDAQVLAAKRRLEENLGSADLVDFLSDELKMKFVMEDDDDDDDEDEHDDDEEDTVMSYETKVSMKVCVSREDGGNGETSCSPVSVTQTTITATTCTGATRVSMAIQQ